MLTSRRLLVGGGAIDRSHELGNLSTAVIVTTTGGSRAFFPASTDAPADMFYVGSDGDDFARLVREQIEHVRPSAPGAPIWEQPEFTHTVRLEDAGLLVAPKGSAVKPGEVVIVMVSSAGVQIRQKGGYAGVLVPWRHVREARVEGVDQVQTRVSVGAVLVFGVLGLAARREEKRAYLTVRTDDGEYLIEDGSHLPRELRSELSPFGITERTTRLAARPRWEYRHLSGPAAQASIWPQLDDLGRAGWEVVGTVSIADELLLTLKREIAAE